jgi:hypothetical protein
MSSLKTIFFIFKLIFSYPHITYAVLTFRRWISVSVTNANLTVFVRLASKAQPAFNVTCAWGSGLSVKHLCSGYVYIHLYIRNFLHFEFPNISTGLHVIWCKRYTITSRSHALLFATLSSNMAEEVNCKGGGGGWILENSANVIYFLTYKITNRPCCMLYHCLSIQYK